MSDLQERLNQLANRGTPRGADAVIDAATAGASLGVIEGERADEDNGADAHDPIPFVTAEPVRRPRRRFSSMIAAAGLSAMLLVGTLAISALVGSGGANSPEGAVRRLADAVHHGDPLAAANVVSPSEVRSLAGSVHAAEKKAAELQLVKTASAPLAGVDLSVDELQLSEEPLADGFVKVRVDEGTLRASTKKAKFSALIQKVLRDTDDNQADVDLSQLIEPEAGLGTFVVTVRQNGHWYVSAAYTALEYAREYNHTQAEPHFGSGAQLASTLGADSPDAAVKNGLQALAHNDWDTLLKLAPPDEIPVYDYRDVLKELITQNDAKTDFTIDKLETTSEVHGSEASVVVNASGKSGDEPWTLNGGCYNPPQQPLQPPGYVGPPSQTYGICVNAAMNPLRLRYLFDSLYTTTDTHETSAQGIKTVQINGRWFLSPVGSILDVVDKWLDATNRRELFLMLGIGDQLPPDGALTLGQPVTFKASDGAAKILTFEGKKGQKLLGLEHAGSQESAGDGPVFVLLYGPDGQSLEVGGAFYGQPVELPVDGTYKFVLQGGSPSSADVTFWNAEDAPETVKNPFPDQQCTYEGNGVASCSSTSAESTPLGEATPLTTPTSVPGPTVSANAGG